MHQTHPYLNIYWDFWICRCICKEERCLWRTDVLSFNPSSCLGKLGFSSHIQQDVKVLEMFLLCEEDLTHVITGLRGTD